MGYSLFVAMTLAMLGCNSQHQWAWESHRQSLTDEQLLEQQELLKELPGYPTGFRRLLPGESITPHSRLLELADSVGKKESSTSVWYEFEIPKSGEGDSATTLAIRVENDVVCEVVFEPAQY